MHYAYAYLRIYILKRWGGGVEREGVSYTSARHIPGVAYSVADRVRNGRPRTSTLER